MNTQHHDNDNYYKQHKALDKAEAALNQEADKAQNTRDNIFFNLENLHAHE